MDDELIEIRAELEVLKLENAGLQAALAALAASLCCFDAETARRTKSLLALTVAEEDIFTDPPRGFPVRAILDRVNAETQEGLDPEQGKAARLVLAAAAGRDHLPALRQWLAQASVDEIAEDIRETLLRSVQRGGQQGGGE